MGEYWYGGVALWGFCVVGVLRCGGVSEGTNLNGRVAVWGSCGVEELRSSVGELWGGGIVVGCIAG